MTFNLVEMIVFSSVIVLIALLVANNIRLALQNKNLVASMVQFSMDKIGLEQALDKISSEYDLISMQETDGFVKFLSESRESAFVYIEEVQQSIKELATAMDSASSTNIEIAYKNLLKYLPKEENND